MERLTYEEWKALYPGCIVFMSQPGYRKTHYMTFNKDALIVSEITDLSANLKQNRVVCMCDDYNSVGEALAHNGYDCIIVHENQIIALFEDEAKVQARNDEERRLEQEKYDRLSKNVQRIEGFKRTCYNCQLGKSFKCTELRGDADTCSDYVFCGSYDKPQLNERRRLNFASSYEEGDGYPVYGYDD